MRSLAFAFTIVFVWRGPKGRTCFSKVPRNFRARKASCLTAIRSFSKADLLTCFSSKKNQEDCEV